MMVRWLGKACVEIESSKNILIDPNYEVKPNKKPDIILITHEHDDHFDKDIIDDYPKAYIYGPKSVFDKFNINGKVVKSGDTINDDIKVLNCRCYNSKESVCYYYNNIFHTADSANYQIPEDNVKLMFSACFKDYFDEYLKLIKKIKPEIIIPYHFNSNDNKKIDEAIELNKSLIESGYDSRLLKPGDSIKID